MDLCSYAEQLWHFYLTEEWTEKAAAFLQTLDEDIVVIGTGKHEFYESLAVFRKALQREEQERSEIHFTIESVSSKEKKCSEDVRLVYGTLHLVGTVENASVIVDMDCRYSVIFQKSSEGIWKIVHVHQSLPNREQHDGEYYPKTLVGQVQEAEIRARQMEELAKIDQLTGIFNHQSFFDECGKLSREKGPFCCMAIDLDNFKQINDVYGHLEGDQVLRETGRILREVSKGRGLAGRIGGDEFALFFAGLPSAEEAGKIAADILEQVRMRGETGPFPGFSIGIACMGEGERVREAFRRADQMLYQVKRGGKNAYQINPEYFAC